MNNGIAKNVHITVTSGMSGHFAAKIGEYEYGLDVIQTGCGRYQNKQDAIEEAKGWAMAEELPFK